MRETAVFFLYLFACLVLGALLTYPVLQTGWIEHDPHRVMGRLAQVFILLGLWPFLKALRLASPAALGYGVSRQGFVRALYRGWLAGVAILLVLAMSLFWLDILMPAPGREDWLWRLVRKTLQVLLAGMLIGFLEETFFRGALFTAIRRRGGVTSAIAWTAFLYALVHFMKPHALADGTVFDASAAWQMFVHVFTGTFQWKHLDSMVALLLVGVFLGLVRERTGHIGWCVGLHSGWVFVIQLTRHLTDSNPASELAWMTGDYDGIIGWLAAIWILLLALGYWAWTRRQPAAEDPEQALRP